MAFWDKQAPSAPPQQAPQQQPQQAPWWQPPAPPAQQPPPQYQQPQHPLMQEQPQQEYRPRKTTKSAGACPECDSPNYMEFSKNRVLNTETGHLVATLRCFDCGYPADNSERGSGKVVGDIDGHARQIAGAGGVVNNWHPEMIVARAPGKRGPRTQ